MLRARKIVIHHAMLMAMPQYPPVHSYCLSVGLHFSVCVCMCTRVFRVFSSSSSELLCDSMSCRVIYLWYSSSFRCNWPGDEMIMVRLNHSVRARLYRLSEAISVGNCELSEQKGNNNNNNKNSWRLLREVLQVWLSTLYPYEMLSCQPGFPTLTWLNKLSFS